MSLKLYFAPGACSFVPHCMLQRAGADFEPIMVNPLTAPTIAHTNARTRRFTFRSMM
jgi:hypothetical protein